MTNEPKAYVMVLAMDWEDTVTYQVSEKGKEHVEIIESAMNESRDWFNVAQQIREKYNDDVLFIMPEFSECVIPRLEDAGAKISRTDEPIPQLVELARREYR